MPQVQEGVCAGAVGLEGVWHVQRPENQQRDWRETETADS